MNAVVNSAAPFVTDERLAHLAPWVPILIAILLVAAGLLADRGKPWPADEEADPAIAPPTATDLVSLEVRRSAADRGGWGRS